MRISDWSSDVCSSDLQAQNFPNKLLVLIDGRSVYSPLFSGVYWDMQDIIPEDVDRIEVNSGPGATLWGANAVKGVINIVTRTAGASQGGHVSALGGSKLSDTALRFGDRNQHMTHYRRDVKGRPRTDTRHTPKYEQKSRKT